MTSLTNRVRASYRQAFGHEPQGIIRAPGRVNLIGEHTDYNDGFVLPCAIGVETQIAWSARPDDRVRAVAVDYDDASDAYALGRIEHHPSGGWRDYVRGMIATSAATGSPLTGVDIAIAGDIPRGAGLSSSASLEVAVGQVMFAAAGLRIDATSLAVLAQRAENEFVGVKCGVMDQLASSASVAGAALLIDCRSLAIQPVPIPSDAAILIVQSGVVRGLVQGHYNLRRTQCEEAAGLLGVPKLRDAGIDLVERTPMPDRIAARARHIVTENGRVLQAAAALRDGDLAQVGALMATSHASMRDDFEISTPKVDELVATAQAAIAERGGGDGGARMTGGGFGGAIVALVRRSAVGAVTDVVRERYRTPAGRPPAIMVADAAAGAGPILA